MAVNSSALQVVEWCNPSTTCYGFCCSIAIIASGDGRQMVKMVYVCMCECVCVCARVTVCVCVCRRMPRMGPWGPGIPPFFPLKMQDFASFFENFPGGGGGPGTPLEGHQRTRLVCVCVYVCVCALVTV